jgi:hypothetical protein
MAHRQQTEFCKNIQKLFPEYFSDRNVLDIGSLDINGNNRFLFNSCGYVGLDIGEGPNVDVISVGHLYNAPDESYDTIISTEVFEHDMFYEDTIRNVIRMLKPGGAFIFTCASTGRPEHGTRKSDGSYAAPLLLQISEEWSDYYKNLTEHDIKSISGFIESFPDGVFQYNSEVGDLYFFGIKGGIPESFKNRLTMIPNPNPELLVSFDMVPKLDVKKSENIDNKTVEFIGIDSLGNENLVYYSPIQNGMWYKPNDVYYKNWKINVGNDTIFQTNLSFDSVCVVVASYPNSMDVKNKTVDTIRNIKQNMGLPVVCSTHIHYEPDPYELIRETDHYIMNPINTLTKQSHYRYYRGQHDNYNVFIDLWESENSYYHGPAVHQCYWNAVKLAKENGYKYAILTNFDMLFSKNDIEKIKCTLNTVIVNKTDGFFFYSMNEEGPTYATVFCIVDIDMFLRKFPNEIMNEDDYNNLMTSVNSESNGLENIYFHVLKNENLSVRNEREINFFESNKCLTNSQADYLAILPMKKESNNDDVIEPHGIFIRRANKDIIETKLILNIIALDNGESIYKNEFVINSDFIKIIPIVFDKTRTYQVTLLDEENSRIIKQTDRIIVDFEVLSNNGNIIYF